MFIRAFEVKAILDQNCKFEFDLQSQQDSDLIVN